MQFVDEILRKAQVGVWKSMPLPKPYVRKGNVSGMARLSLDNLWRVGTRHEIITNYNNTMKRTYKNITFAVISLAGAYVTYTSYAASGDLSLAVAAIACAGLVSRFWTKAWGGYAGDWSDYEHDPVRAVTHNAYVLNGGRGMM